MLRRNPKGGRRGGKSLVPRWARDLKKQRDRALEIAEAWIEIKGGDRSQRDPGPSYDDEDMPLLGQAFIDRRSLEGQVKQQMKAARALGLGRTREREVRGHVFDAGVRGLHKWLRWANFGMPAFVLDAETAGMLALTDVDNLDISDVHLPFPTFMLVLEPGSNIKMFNVQRRKEEPVQAVVVHVYEPAEAEAREGKYDRYLEMTIIGKSGFRREFGMDYPEKNGRVRKWIEAIGREVGAFAEAAKEREVEMIESHAGPLAIAVLRLVLSFAMLFRAEGAKPKKPRHTVASRRHDQSELPLPQDWAVTRVQMPTQVKAALEESGAVGRGGVLTARHVVRGHWKMQPHGPGMKLRKPTRIDPYWRGAGPEALTKEMRPITPRRSRSKRTDNPRERRARLRRLMRGT
jgi:hypothetical protein